VFYYYGAKNRYAKRYPAPQHSLIVEPFAGSAGYAMRHLEQDGGLRAVLVEKDPRVAELWRRLLGMSPEEVESYPLPDVGDRTTDYFIMCSAASNALAKCKTFKVTERAATEFRRMRRRVARILRAVRGRVEVIEGDYTRAPNDEATWFIDPPYQVPADSASRAANPAGMGYARGCDASSMDYRRLARWCRSRRGQVIVCEYASATWLPFRPLVNAQNASGKKHLEGVWEASERCPGCAALMRLNGSSWECSCGSRVRYLPLNEETCKLITRNRS